jgi:hypothetical protein
MPTLQSPRFAGDPILEACLNGQHRMLAPQIGEAVKKVQRALRDLGFPLPLTFARGDADGQYGDETARAVSRFKRDNNIEPSDGVVGRKTMAALDGLFTSSPPPNPPSPPRPPIPQRPSPPPAAPSAPSPVPNHKLLLAGIWNSATTLRIQGGQSMTFILTNTNVLGTTITIAAQSGQKHSQVLIPILPVRINFSVFGREPMGWVFSIRTDSDAFLVTWQLWSTWVPGDPPNP